MTLPFLPALWGAAGTAVEVAGAVAGTLMVVNTLVKLWAGPPPKVFKSSQGGDVIVQLFEWRWDDIAEECRNFLPQHGYTAVQTSPVTENAVLEGRPWFERYQPFSYDIETRSGDENAFKNMVEVCIQNNIKVYVDVILNHMATNLPNGTVGTAGSRPDTQNKNYLNVPYRSRDFHESCPIQDWNNATQVRNCELEGRHDLNTSSEYVRKRIVMFLNKLIKMGVAGFRVDAAKHVNVEDFEDIYSRLNDLNTMYFPANSRPFIYQEVSGVGAILPSDYVKLGSVEDFKYGAELSLAFRKKKDLRWFKTFDERWTLLPWNESVVFIDNPDTQRQGSLSYKESKLYKMAVGFMLAWPHSVTRVMSGFDFTSSDQGPPSSGPDSQISRVIRNKDNSCAGGWICEHRWRQIYNMVIFRKMVHDSEVSDWWDNGFYQIAFCRKGKGFVAFNREGFPLNANLQTCLPSGIYCDVISGSKTDNTTCSGKSVTVGTDGRANITIPHNQEDGILAIHIESKISLK